MIFNLYIFSRTGVRDFSTPRAPHAVHFPHTAHTSDVPVLQRVVPPFFLPARPPRRGPQADVWFAIFAEAADEQGHAHPVRALAPQFPTSAPSRSPIRHRRFRSEPASQTPLMGPEQGFFRFATDSYVLHHLETPTGYKFALCADAAAGPAGRAVDPVLGDLCVLCAEEPPLCARHAHPKRGLCKGGGRPGQGARGVHTLIANEIKKFFDQLPGSCPVPEICM